MLTSHVWCLVDPQRGDCCAFAPCYEKDPQYARLVGEAVAAGALAPLWGRFCSWDCFQPVGWSDAYAHATAFLQALSILHWKLFWYGVVSCYPRSAAGRTSRPGGVLRVLGVTVERVCRCCFFAGVAVVAAVCRLDEAAGAVQFGGTLPVRLDYKRPTE